MKVIRWGERRFAGASSGRRGSFRRSARATALTAVAMMTSIGLVTTATAAPVIGEGVLPGLGAVQNAAAPAAGADQSGAQPGDLPLPTGDLLGGAMQKPAGSPSTPQLPLVGDVTGKAPDGSAAPADLPLVGDVTGQGGSPLADLPLAGGEGSSELAQPDNTETPGMYVNKPDGEIQLGELSNETSAGEKLEDGTTRYLADPRARDFNGSTGGWVAYQEFSPLCTVRGVGCINWNFRHDPNGGANGDGDGAMVTDGTSLGVAPCTPQNGVARWLSPLFNFDVKDAKSWKFEMDVHQTTLLVGDGHSAYKVEVIDEDGRVVTTALGPNGTFPLNKWDHVEANFDGSEMAFGKNYRISIVVDVVHAETALNLGDVAFDNPSLTVGTEPGPAPTVPCTVDGSTDGLPPGPGPAIRPPDLCSSLTNPLGQALAPILDTAYCLLACNELNGTLDSLRGVFIIGDLETGQLLGYLAGKEAIPSIDPRNLLMYLKDGSLGKLAGYAVLFVGNTLGLVQEILSDPVGNVVRLVEGQLKNVMDLLADPGRLLRIPVPWTVDELKWVLSTLLNPPGTSQTALGGMVFRDDNKNGKLDPGEPGVQGVNVNLIDENGNPYGTVTTGPDGRYLFANPQPRFEPSSYRLVFMKPDGTTFTQKHVPGSVHANTSNPNPETGQTDRITIVKGQVDLNWHAGLLPTDNGNGETPDPDAVVDVCAGVPTINGQDAGTSPGPEFAGGEPINITLPVTNCGNRPVNMSDMDVTSEYGDFTCTDANGDGKLDVGETATCTLDTTARPGTNTVHIDITVPDANGQPLTKQCLAHYTAPDAPCPCDEKKES